jgi:hypothetical protein
MDKSLREAAVESCMPAWAVATQERKRDQNRRDLFISTAAEAVMKSRVSMLVCAVLLVAGGAQATSFVVPDDNELIQKSAAIAVGTVEGSYVQELNGTIETVYEIRVERALKGLPRVQELLRMVSPGGVIGDRGLYVASSPHFAQGDRVLLFLNRNHGRWETTDLTLGKFKFVTSTSGEPLLVRDMEDVVGWDRNGEVHHEKVRKESGFLQFIDERVRGRSGPVAQSDYIVDASTVTLPPPEKRGTIQANATAPFPGATYTDWVNNQPIRWPNISAGVTYYKRVDQNIPGAADGGVSVIQNGLAAWNNECGSNINLIYGGTTATVSANFDTTHVVEFNDPQQRISGSWTGSGTIAIAFMSFSSTHTFDGQTWWSISDGDVVFQDGFPATHAAFQTAMTHEFGHTIGWRHSNQDYSTKGACNSATQECTSAAIMNATVNAGYGTTLQPWDIHAAESVYPGGTCGTTCTPPVITAQPQSATITPGTTRTLTVTATGTAPLAYQWYIGASGNTATPINGATTNAITITPTSTTSYWVRVSNSCGSLNSATATLTVSSAPPPPPPPATRRTLGDYNGDGRSDATLFRPSTGQWLIQGIGVIQYGQTGDQPVPGDYDGDRKDDIAVFRPSEGMWFIRYTAGGGMSMVWGQSGDIAVPEDYDGDGRTDIAIYRPSQGMWFIHYMAGGGTSYSWGISTDVPVPADYTGDRIADIAVFRPSNGQWYIRNVGTVQWGQVNDQPVPADFDGNGTADVVVFRAFQGMWFIHYMAGATSGTSFQWGQSNDQAAPGDYDGDGRADAAIFRPSQGMWFIRYTAGGGTSFSWGLPGDIAVYK